MTARSYATWNGPGDTPPLNAHSGNIDIVVVKLDGSGAYQWHTFYGSAGADYGYGIAVDPSGNVYVTGYSDATWGSPLHAHAGGGNSDIVVVKLNGSGVYQWHTFHGSKYYYDSGVAIAVDSAGNVYVTGDSAATWGSPIDPHVSIWGEDIVVVKLNSSGALQWNTFHGSNDHDRSYGIAVDPSGNVYVTGWSTFGWGTPINACKEDGNASGDIVVFKLNSSGALQWNTFHGSWSHDWGLGIAADSSGNAYVTGYSLATWGSPLNAHLGGFDDIVVAKLNSSGALQWNTFHGSSSPDRGRDIAVDSSGNVYVTGYSAATWGSPPNAHAGGNDIVVAKLSSSGALQRNTFYGSSNADAASGIAVDSAGNAYVTGTSGATWNGPGNTPPLNAYAGGQDIVVVKSASVSGPTPTPTPSATPTATASATPTATSTSCTGDYSLSPYDYGDASMDGMVNVLDLAQVNNILKGLLLPNSASDATADGLTDVLDLTQVTNILKGLVLPTARYVVGFDFSTGGGTAHVAVYKQVAGMPADIFANETGWQTFNGGDYSDVEDIDASDFSMSANASGYNAVQCRFTVDGGIDMSNVTDMGIDFTGTSGALEVWAWNFDTSNWSQVCTDISVPAGEGTNSAHTACESWGKVLDSYVDGSWHMYILFIHDVVNNDLDVDYVRMELAYP